MDALTPAALIAGAKAEAPAPADRLARDGLIVALGGQVERLLGILTALALRWGLDPSRLGVYTGLRLFLDNTNRSSLGVGLGAVQEIPVLIARGREAEAKRVADVAHTINTLTCLAYSAALVAWAAWRWSQGAGGPLAFEWAGGLFAVAGLALLRRYESFLIAVLRARGEFGLTTRVDVLEGLISSVLVAGGLWLAGFWGLLAAVGLIFASKIAFLHACHSLRFHWAWDATLAWRLMRTGLPILANTAAFGFVLGLDRILILGLVPDGERAAGLYSIALLGTSWSLDLAGRLVIVLSTHFLTTLGRTEDPAAVARQAAQAAEAQATILAAGAAVAYVLAPAILSALIPKYAEGLPALRPLLPGMVLLGLAWPARQLLIALGRPYRLLIATGLGLTVLAGAGALGASGAGIVGVAWGVSTGYAAVSFATSLAALGPTLGTGGWLVHQARLHLKLAPHVFAALVAAHLPLELSGVPEFLVRGLIVGVLVSPSLVGWIGQYARTPARAWLRRLGL